MKAKTVILKTIRVTAAVVFALVLLVAGVVLTLYSPWAQELVRRGVTGSMDGHDGGIAIALDGFRLSFPLTLELEGFAMSHDGDTLMSAGSARAELALLPLLRGCASIDDLELMHATYTMGAPDSAMYLTIRADSLQLAPASFDLSDMSINLTRGAITGGRLSMVLATDTSAPTPPAPPTKMSVNIGRIALDDFTYTMRMMPTIDTLTAHIASSELRGGNIDLFSQAIRLGNFSGHGLDARYIAPDSADTATFGPVPQPVPVPDSLKTAPWTVQIDTISFADSHALYTTRGVVPQPGLDFGYIEVADLDLNIHNFYNRETDVTVPLSLRGTERSGVELMLDGTMAIDSTALRFDDMNLSTPSATSMSFRGLMGMGDMVADPTVPLQLVLDGAFAPSDLGMVFPAFTPYLAGIPSSSDVMFSADASGTSGHLDVDELTLRLNNCVSLSASGAVENMMNPAAIGGNLALKGNIINVNPLKNKILDPATAKTFNIPPMTLAGNVAMRGGTVSGNLRAATGKGHIRMDARWNSRAEGYAADVTTEEFPVNAFMPTFGVGTVTATLDADGHGYDPFAETTTLNASLDVKSAEYQGTVYRDIMGSAAVADGHADINLTSTNPDAEFTVKASGNLSGKVYEWTADIDGTNIDLFALKLAAEPASVEALAHIQAAVGPTMNDIAANIDLTDLYFRQKSGTIGITDVSAVLDARDSMVMLNVTNRDLSASFNAPMSIDSLAAEFARASAVMASNLKGYKLDIDSISAVLPHFALTVTGGQSNMVNDLLATSKMSVKKFMLSVNNDEFMTMGGYAERFETESMLIDSIYINGRQHGGRLDLMAGIANRPGNMDQWHKVKLDGRIENSTASLKLRQENLRGDTGFDFGITAKATPDSTITLSVRPLTPVIGYQKWTVNDDNFVSVNIPARHIHANLRMQGAGSSLALYTEEVPGDSTVVHATQEDLVVRLDDIHIADWISFNPFAPPVKGDIDADMRINYYNGTVLGKGSAGITNFKYGKEKASDFKAVFDVAANTAGSITANADLLVDGVKTMTLSGALNDTTATSPLALDFSMIRFPLASVNPFMPAGTAKLRGTLNGHLKIKGTEDKPVMNGTIDFEKAAIRLAMTGTDYTFSDVPIDVTDNIVQFNRFAIAGCNANPLYVDGTVDISDMADMKLNLGLKADNMMIVNSSRPPRGADVFGKAYISLDASATGNMSLMSVNANLSLLSATNVTYVMQEATAALASKETEDMVKFVNFSDSAAVAEADSLTRGGMSMFLDATLNIQNGSVINVNLSDDGQNKVQIQSNGTLTYSMTPLDQQGRLTGRLNIEKGFARYSPPFMSEKNFVFDNNASSVTFTGDMLNPSLDIHATDQMKANVTQADRDSRLVDFNVLLSVTGTLERMDVKFDLSTNDDMTVANELESMSPEQRANQAMNMLLYNIYTGAGTKGNASLAGNPLFSFLESRVNSWAANNIRGVDLSFGIDQYDKTVDGATSQTMRYSYQVSKSLFDDRFKIVVGGNYSTDAGTDENFSQNLINDISFEYFLNRQRSMYLRLFRHTGYESILEGEITQTGVGFVYRRKIRRLGDMFLTPGQVRRRQERANIREQQQAENYVNP